MWDSYSHSTTHYHITISPHGNYSHVHYHYLHRVNETCRLSTRLSRKLSIQGAIVMVTLTIALKPLVGKIRRAQSRRVCTNGPTTKNCESLKYLIFMQNVKTLNLCVISLILHSPRSFLTNMRIFNRILKWFCYNVATVCLFS